MLGHVKADGQNDWLMHRRSATSGSGAPRHPSLRVRRLQYFQMVHHQARTNINIYQRVNHLDRGLSGYSGFYFWPPPLQVC